MTGLIFLFIMLQFICFLFSLLGAIISYNFNSLILKILYLFQGILVLGSAIFFDVLSKELTTAGTCLIFLGGMASLLYASSKMEQCVYNDNK